MTKFYSLCLLRFTGFLCLTSFSVQIFSAQSYAAEKPLVVSSIRPLALIVETLASDLVESEVLLQAGDSPHHLALKVSQLEKLYAADLVLWVGPEFERFLVKPLRKRSSSLAFAGLATEQHAAEVHIHGEQHLWLHPVWVRAFVEALARSLIERVPQHSEPIKARMTAFLQDFSQLEQQLQTRFAGFEGGFIVYHPALDEYVSAYQLNQLGSVLEGSEASPSVQRLAQLKKKSRDASCLLADTAEIEAAKRYATLLELTVQEVDILGVNPEVENWFEYYTGLSDSVIQCLRLKQQPGH